jgi:cutinase
MHLCFRALAGALALAAAATACTTPPTGVPGTPPGDPSSVRPCSPVEVISARGSLEPATGSRVIGRAVDAVLAAVPGSTRYEVRYPATADFQTSPQKGANDLLGHLVAQAARCPDQRYVLMGYSQGTIVLQLSFDHVPEALFDRVPAVVLFGSPYFKADSPAATGTARGANGSYPQRQPARWAAKTLDVCNEGDIVCGAGASVAAHYSYDNAAQAAQAAAFVAERLGTAG